MSSAGKEIDERMKKMMEAFGQRLTQRAENMKALVRMLNNGSRHVIMAQAALESEKFDIATNPNRFRVNHWN